MSPEMNRGPVSPKDAAELWTEQIPEVVFETFNLLIAQNLSDGRSRVLQKDVVAQLEATGLERSEIFKLRLLDVENSYRAVGWNVKYDKPIYYGGEDFEPYFLFTEAKR